MVRSNEKSGEATELGGVGELGGFQFSQAGLHPIHAALDDRQFTAKRMDQRVYFLGPRRDSIKAELEQGRRLVPADGLLTSETTTGVTSRASVLLHQVLQRLVGPIRGHHISEGTDAARLSPGQGRNRHGQHSSSCSGSRELPDK